MTNIHFPTPPTGLRRVPTLDTSAVDGAHHYDREFDFRRVVVAEHFVQKRTKLLRSNSDRIYHRVSASRQVIESEAGKPVRVGVRFVRPVRRSATHHINDASLGARPQVLSDRVDIVDKFINVFQRLNTS